MMIKQIIRGAVLAAIVATVVSCGGQTATQRRADENARLSRYIADSGYVITTVLPDSLGPWADTIDGVVHDIYYKNASGMLYHEIIRGPGKPTYYNPQTRTGSNVAVRYSLTTLESDSVIDNNQLSAPLQYTIGSSSVIQGMSQAAVLMREGGRARVIMPSIIAYDSYGTGDGTILPYQTIVYQIDLLDVK